MPLIEPPKVIAPPAVLRVRSPLRVIAVLLSPRCSVVLVVAIVPAALMAVGAVAITPPVKVNVSVLALPRTRLPVFRNVVALVTLVVPPNSSRW